MASTVAPSLEGSVQGIQSAAFEGLLQKIHRREAKVGIIGLGCVGLPLAVEFARAGFSVAGFDTDRWPKLAKRIVPSLLPTTVVSITPRSFVGRPWSSIHETPSVDSATKKSSGFRSGIWQVIERV
jgi:UDP-N-acetylmuramoylalanine-D-glutamate ligase